ncbi:uncharacterized protein LOC128676406 [Plodia interpunctella]|uniref:uncharacterized protein LOC128676406 n=1 Tax=Plodia interpunctella TaxID=58824 RepID=UPI00236778D8|nr:uncharacterized protein LOC128676406 isoform X2 [Plodia interpunctella]
MRNLASVILIVAFISSQKVNVMAQFGLLGRLMGPRLPPIVMAPPMMRPPVVYATPPPPVVVAPPAARPAAFPPAIVNVVSDSDRARVDAPPGAVVNSV